jgi:hypothetical protein
MRTQCLEMYLFIYHNTLFQSLAEIQDLHNALFFLFISLESSDVSPITHVLFTMILSQFSYLPKLYKLLISSGIFYSSKSSRHRKPSTPASHNTLSDKTVHLHF